MPGTPVYIPSRGGAPAPCRGIDQRSLQVGADPSSVWDAVNCDLTDSGDIKIRDGLVLHAQLPPGTLGLYALGGNLRVAVPAGHGIQGVLPPNVIGDVIGDTPNEATAIGRYTRVTSVTSWGAGDGDRGALPYLVLRTAAGQYVHHWIRTSPELPTSPVKTKIETGFVPGPDVVKFKQKIYAVNVLDRVIQYSSTEFGPGTWSETDAPDDAGFLNVNEHALSDTEITGLTLHQGKLGVVFAQAMQFWSVFADPAQNQFGFALNGPGTNVFGSLKPVVGDVFYFSEGGFQSLVTQTQTGELREQGFGAPVRELSRQFLNAASEDVASVWSQARAQYLCAFNTGTTSTVFAYKWLPAMGVTGFTRWSLPVRVDYWAELDGILYIRSGDDVYRFDPMSGHDDTLAGEVDITAYFDTQFVDGGIAAVEKQWLTFDAEAEGEYDVSMLSDRRNRSLVEPVALRLNGSTYDKDTIPFDALLHAVAVRITLREGTVIGGIRLTCSVLPGTA